MSGWGVFLVIIAVVLILSAGGWIIYTQYRARRLGLPAPSLNPFARPRNTASSNYTAPAPAPGGVQGWISNKISALRNSRTSAGAYESTGYQNSRRGFGPLDPDEAWDTRVGNEADYGVGGAGGYYEEQELGLQDPSHGPYGGGGYGGRVGVGGIEEGRGRSRERQRELDGRYEEEMHGGPTRGANPFGDNAERSDVSLRGVSPRPMVDTKVATRPSHKSQKSLGAQSTDDSPTERRSAFQEQM